MFEKYPDIVGLNELKEMLGIGRNTALRIVHSGELNYFRIGKIIKIPKTSVIAYVEKHF